MLRIILKDDMDLVTRDSDFDKPIGYTLRQLALLLDGASLPHLDSYYRYNASLCLVSFELFLQGFDFLHLLQTLVTKRLAAFEFIILQYNNEQLPAFPATVRSLVIRFQQGDSTLAIAFGALYLNQHSSTSLI